MPGGTLRVGGFIRVGGPLPSSSSSVPTGFHLATRLHLGFFSGRRSTGGIQAGGFEDFGIQIGLSGTYLGCPASVDYDGIIGMVTSSM